MLIRENGLIFGSSGVGKTRLAGTTIEVPELMPSLYIGAERRISIIRDKVELVDNSKIIDDYSKDKLTTVFFDNVSELEKILDKCYDSYSKESLPFNSIWIDSISSVNYLDLKGSGRYTGKMRFGNHSKSEYADWNRALDNINAIGEFLKYFQSTYIFLTALPRVVENDVMGVEVISPSVFPKTAPEALMSHLDIAGYLHHKKITNGVKQILQFEPDGIVRCKHTFTDKPFNIEEPTMQKLFNKLS